MKLAPTLALLSLAALGGTLAFTNPNEDDYAAYLSKTVTVEAQATLCSPEDFSTWLGKIGEALSSACQSILAGGEKLSEDQVQEIIKDSTEYKNRFLFSTYDTETPFGNYRAIGLFDRFIISSSEETATESE